MKRYDTIFLDRDGTLNPDPGYISDIKDFEFFPFTMAALEIMKSRCNQFCIITNQSGVGRGIIKEEKVKEIHDFIKIEFRNHNIALINIYMCTDHPDNASNNRKPGTGMFEKAAVENGLLLDKSLIVGDAGSDIEAGVKLEMDTMLVLTGRGPESLQTLSKEYTPKYVVENLLAGAELLNS